jgi:hypothetical protein
MEEMEELDRNRNESRRMATSSHHSADTAVALFISAVTSEAWLGNRLDGLFNRATGAARREGEVERLGDGGDSHGGERCWIWYTSRLDDEHNQYEIEAYLRSKPRVKCVGLKTAGLGK